MGSRAAFALSADAGEPGGAAPVYHFTESFNPQGGAMPFTIIDQRPDPLAASTKAASQVWGSQLNLALNLQSSLASSVYFSRSLPLYEALRNGNLFGDDDSAPGFLALRGPGAGHVLDRGRALQQKLDYSTARFQLHGSYVDVDKAFSAPNAGNVSVTGDRSPVDALAALRGMKELKFQGQFTPWKPLQLTYSRDRIADDREGSKEQGLTRDVSKQSLVWQLNGRARLDVNLNQLTEAWDPSRAQPGTDKKTSDYALHYVFSGATKADLVRNLTTVTTNGTKTDIGTTQLHLEHKPGARLNLAADWMDRNRSDGSAEEQTSLSLDSVIGSGKGKLALTGLYKQHSEGASDKQVDTLYRLGLATAPSPLLRLNAKYEALNQHGPSGDHDFVRTDLGLVSQLYHHTKFTAGYARETDKQVQTKTDTNARIEVNPGWLGLTAAINTAQRQGEPDLTTTSGDLKIKFGRPLANWAKAVSGADPLPGATAYGYRGAPGWAALGNGAITLNYIRRAAQGQPQVVTRVLGYQTMLWRHGYVKLAMHNNPMVKQDDQMVVAPARWDTYEGGLDLGNGFAALTRFIREKDLQKGDATQTRLLGLRGAIGGGDMLTFIGGVQKLQPENGSATDWQFANVNLKFGRPLADWAKAASNNGLFDDNVKYGYRQLPAWTWFGDRGLSLRYMSRQSQSGDSLIASGAGYQTMLGRHTYAKLSFQQNPLDGNGQVIPADRKLYEIGRRFGAKFVALARYMTDYDFAGQKALRSSMLGFRGRLSEHDRLETVIVLDDVSSQGDHDQSRTYGLEYAREIGDGHYLVLKGTYSNNDTPGTAVSPECYQIDFAYKKDI